jgi:eukaryotic-like serine/threonine-protein kinase
MATTHPTVLTRENRTPMPKQLGRYRIINEVGRGATAFVYKAYDPQLERYLAVKVLRQELAKDEDYRNAFLREARLAAQLTHPAIVTIFDVGIAEKKPYIAMELLEGLTLEDILKAQGHVNLKTTLAMAIQISSGLNYAHKQGVVHRDIKPANIVVLKDKKTVKLTDFGIAQLNDTLGVAGKQSDKVLGTPEYMSPEQILARPMDARSDIYSFGILIYQLLSGKPPFFDRDLGVLFKKIVKDKAPPLVVDGLAQQEKIQDDLNDLIRKLLQKNAHKRFNSAALVTAELRQIKAKLSQKKKAKGQLFISLKLRWTAIMAALMFIAMCISLTVVYWVQNNTLSVITSDYGRSMAHMIAYQSAEPVLLDDLIALKTVVNETSKNQQLESVHVMDLNQLVIASTAPDLVGQVFSQPEGAELSKTIDITNVYLRKDAAGKNYFDIEMPIVYGTKTIAHLYLSFNAEPRNQAAKKTLITMLGVMIVALILILIVTLVLANKTARDFSRVSQGLDKMSAGRFDARLPYERNDEVGQLYAAFNQLAQQFENKYQSEASNKVDRAVKNVAKIAVTAERQNQGADTEQPHPKKINEFNQHQTVELDIQSEFKDSPKQKIKPTR